VLSFLIRLEGDINVTRDELEAILFEGSFDSLSRKPLAVRANNTIDRGSESQNSTSQWPHLPDLGLGLVR